jgi:hypothetical protein
MALFSFLSKIRQGIKGLFDNTPVELQKAAHIGVVVAENVKTFVDSPETDVLTALIPGNVDDYIKILLRARLPAILTELMLASNCTRLTGLSAITGCTIKVLQDLEPDIQNAFLHNISILIAQVASDGKLTWSNGVYLLGWYRKNKFQEASPLATT